MNAFTAADDPFHANGEHVKAQPDSMAAKKEKSKPSIQLCQLLVIIIGLGVAVWEIRTFVSEQRQNRAIHFVTQYYSTEEQFLEDVLNITEIQYSGIEEYVKADDTADFANDPEGYFQEARRYVVEKFEAAEHAAAQSDGGIESIFVDIVRVSSFFDSVAACSLSGSCDKGIVSHGLKQEMYTFFNAMCAVHSQVQSVMNTGEIMASTVRLLAQDDEWRSALYFCQDIFDDLNGL